MKKKNIIFIIMIFIVISVLLGCLISCTNEASSLDKPVIKLTDNIISWEKVEGADLYKVKVGLNSYIVEENSYKIDIKENGIYEVCCVAMKDDCESEESNRLLFKCEKKEVVNAPEISLKDENTICWNKVSENASYLIYQNDEVITQINKSDVLTYEYTFNDLKEGSYDIYVVAKDNNKLSEISNKITLTIDKNSTYTTLDTPVVTLNGKVISWNKVENATKYFIYLDYEIVKIQEELEYTIEAKYGTHHLQVKAASNNEAFLASDKSTKVFVNIAIQDEKVDFTKPVTMFTISSRKMPTFNKDNLMIIGNEFNINKLEEAVSFMLIKEGNNYRIKLTNGLFLTHTKVENNQDAFYAMPKVSGNSQLFNIENVGIDDFTYKIVPINNPGYLLCEDGSSGYHQYMEIINNNKISDEQLFTIVNKEATFAEDVLSPIENPQKCDLTKELVMYTKGSGKVFSFNENGEMVKGVNVFSLTNFEEYKVILIAKGDCFNIKLSDGSFLTYTKKNDADYFSKESATDDDTQLFKIEYENGIYKIKPKTNLGYLLCEDDYDKYHLYSDCNVSSQFWVLFNVNKNE